MPIVNNQTQYEQSCRLINATIEKIKTSVTNDSSDITQVQKLVIFLESSLLKQQSLVNQDLLTKLASTSSSLHSSTIITREQGESDAAYSQRLHETLANLSKKHDITLRALDHEKRAHEACHKEVHRLRAVLMTLLTDAGSKTVATSEGFIRLRNKVVAQLARYVDCISKLQKDLQSRSGSSSDVDLQDSIKEFGNQIDQVKASLKQDLANLTDVTQQDSDQNGLASEVEKKLSLYERVLDLERQLESKEALTPALQMSSHEAKKAVSQIKSSDLFPCELLEKQQDEEAAVLPDALDAVALGALAVSGKQAEDDTNADKAGEHVETIREDDQPKDDAHILEAGEDKAQCNEEASQESEVKESQATEVASLEEELIEETPKDLEAENDDQVNDFKEQEPEAQDDSQEAIAADGLKESPSDILENSEDKFSFNDEAEEEPEAMKPVEKDEIESFGYGDEQLQSQENAPFTKEDELSADMDEPPSEDEKLAATLSEESTCKDGDNVLVSEEEESAAALPRDIDFSESPAESLTTPEAEEEDQADEAAIVSNDLDESRSLTTETETSDQASLEADKLNNDDYEAKELEDPFTAESQNEDEAPSAENDNNEDAVFVSEKPSTEEITHDQLIGEDSVESDSRSLNDSNVAPFETEQQIEESRDDTSDLDECQEESASPAEVDAVDSVPAAEDSSRSESNADSQDPLDEELFAEDSALELQSVENIQRRDSSASVRSEPELENVPVMFQQDDSQINAQEPLEERMSDPTSESRGISEDVEEESDYKIDEAPASSGSSFDEESVEEVSGEKEFPLYESQEKSAPEDQIDANIAAVCDENVSEDSEEVVSSSEPMCEDDNSTKDAFNDQNKNIELESPEVLQDATETFLEASIADESIEKEEDADPVQFSAEETEKDTNNLKEDDRTDISVFENEDPESIEKEIRKEELCESETLPEYAFLDQIQHDQQSFPSEQEEAAESFNGEEEKEGSEPSAADEALSNRELNEHSVSSEQEEAAEVSAEYFDEPEEKESSKPAAANEALSNRELNEQSFLPGQPEESKSMEESSAPVYGEEDRHLSDSEAAFTSDESVSKESIEMDVLPETAEHGKEDQDTFETPEESKELAEEEILGDEDIERELATDNQEPHEIESSAKDKQIPLVSESITEADVTESLSKSEEPAEQVCGPSDKKEEPEQAKQLEVASTEVFEEDDSNDSNVKEVLSEEPLQVELENGNDVDNLLNDAADELLQDQAQSQEKESQEQKNASDEGLAKSEEKLEKESEKLDGMDSVAVEAETSDPFDDANISEAVPEKGQTYFAKQDSLAESICLNENVTEDRNLGLEPVEECSDIAQESGASEESNDPRPFLTSDTIQSTETVPSHVFRDDVETEKTLDENEQVFSNREQQDENATESELLPFEAEELKTSKDTCELNESEPAMDINEDEFSTEEFSRALETDSSNDSQQPEMVDDLAQKDLTTANEEAMKEPGSESVLQQSFEEENQEVQPNESFAPVSRSLEKEESSYSVPSHTDDTDILIKKDEAEKKKKSWFSPFTKLFKKQKSKEDDVETQQPESLAEETTDVIAKDHVDMTNVEPIYAASPEENEEDEIEETLLEDPELHAVLEEEKSNAVSDTPEDHAQHATQKLEDVMSQLEQSKEMEPDYVESVSSAMPSETEQEPVQIDETCEEKDEEEDRVPEMKQKLADIMAQIEKSKSIVIDNDNDAAEDILPIPVAYNDDQGSIYSKNEDFDSSDKPYSQEESAPKELQAVTEMDDMAHLGSASEVGDSQELTEMKESMDESEYENPKESHKSEPSIYESVEKEVEEGNMKSCPDLSESNYEDINSSIEQAIEELSEQSQKSREMLADLEEEEHLEDSAAPLKELEPVVAPASAPLSDEQVQEILDNPYIPEAVKDSIKIMKQQNDDMRQSMEEAIKNQDSLKKELKEKDETISALKEDNVKLDNQIKELEKENDELFKKNLDGMVDRQRADASNKEMEDKIKELEKMIPELHSLVVEKKEVLNVETREMLTRLKNIWRDLMVLYVEKEEMPNFEPISDIEFILDQIDVSVMCVSTELKASKARISN